MKKIYQAPDIEIVEFEFESHVMTASADLPGTGDGGTTPPSGDGDDSFGDANRHRGEWGNLWAED